MASSSSVAWMPTQGRHKINIGPSLGRSIRARKLKGSPGQPSSTTTTTKRFPERDFYAFRYNFKPGAIDGTKPASIEVKKTLENTQITAEFPSKEMSEVCTYNGTEIPAKEVECIIIYDEETGQYSLEKLDSVVSLQFGGKRTATTPAAPSVPSPATASTSSTPLANTTKRKARTAENDDDDELEQLLLQDNNNNNNSAHKRAAAINLRREEEEEEEEGEDTDIPLRLQVQVPKRAPPPSTTTTTTTTPNRTTKPMKTTTTPNVKAAIVNTSQLPPSSSILAKSKPTQSSSSAIPAAAAAKAPKPTPKQTKKPKAVPLPTLADNKNVTTSSYADEEIIEIERPAKKPRISSSSSTTAPITTTTTTFRPPAPAPAPPQAVEPPKPKPPVELSLPGGQSTFVAPPAPLGSIVPPKKATNTNAPVIIPMTIPPGVSANITMEEVLGDEVDEVEAVEAVEEEQQEVDEDEDEDEDWEAVPTSAPLVHQPDSYGDDDDDGDEIFGQQAFGEDEEGQEIDINAFEAELNEQMEQQEEEGEGEGDDDDDMEDVMQDVGGVVANRPISLNRLASGIAVGESDDDYSSSETDSD